MIDPEAFAMWNHIVAKLDFWAPASFKACQTVERCSQQPGIFSIQPFCMELFINLVYIGLVCRCLEIKLKKNSPQYLKELLHKSLRICSQKDFQNVYNLSASPLNGNFTSFKTNLKLLKRNLLILEHFRVDKLSKKSS